MERYENGNGKHQQFARNSRGRRKRKVSAALAMVTVLFFFWAL